MEDLIEIVFAVLLGELPWQFVVLGGILVAGYYAAGFMATAEPELRRGLIVGAFAVAGALTGALSVWVFPGHYLHEYWVRWLNLLLGPVAGGSLMLGLDHLLRSKLKPGTASAEPAKPKPVRKGKRGAKAIDDAPPQPSLPPTDRQLFARGFLFCLAFAVVRFVWGG